MKFCKEHANVCNLFVFSSTDMSFYFNTFLIVKLSFFKLLEETPGTLHVPIRLWLVLCPHTSFSFAPSLTATPGHTITLAPSKTLQWKDLLVVDNGNNGNQLNQSLNSVLGVRTSSPTEYFKPVLSERLFNSYLSESWEPVFIAMREVVLEISWSESECSFTFILYWRWMKVSK